MLHNTKRQARSRTDHAVDEHAAGLEFGNELFLLVGVVGPGSRAETERRCVSESNRFIDVVNAKQRRDWAEDLFARNWCRWIEVDQHRRFVKISRTIESFPASEHACARCDSVLNLLFEIVDDLWRRKWANISFLVERITYDQRFHLLDKSALKLFINLTGDDEAFRGNARLAIIDRAGFDGGRNRFVEVGGRHHDERIAATEFEHCLLDLLAGDARDTRARRFAAGQRRGHNARICENVSNFIRANQQRLKRAFRKTGATEDVFDRECALRHV